MGKICQTTADKSNVRVCKRLIISSPCQISPYIVILVPSWFISLFCDFYLIEPIFRSHFQSVLNFPILNHRCTCLSSWTYIFGLHQLKGGSARSKKWLRISSVIDATRSKQQKRGGGNSHLQFQFPIVGHQMTICEEKTKLVTFNIKTMLFLG